MPASNGLVRAHYGVVILQTERRASALHRPADAVVGRAADAQAEGEEAERGTEPSTTARELGGLGLPCGS